MVAAGGGHSTIQDLDRYGSKYPVGVHSASVLAQWRPVGPSHPTLETSNGSKENSGTQSTLHANPNYLR
ncbi:hypothetical protein M752DRAFT_50226 [Aspergillus phoenicis ATCC 13157]|uniref:Uncharacterized protein n=1 Tax=Aspergillus phoenicis ATCC 13157 TaxID=1353007 RepID=A0A370PBI4_ASPPH|nr:hypothetical protein M752DRAFT_50226 [Aspergillus phoenicis ATCC 13157]